jgi:hypothetical protein
MKLGAEPKKIALLAMLGGAAGYLLYSNLISGDERPVAPRSTLRRDFDAPQAAEPRTPTAPRPRSPEFRPSLKSGRTDGGVDAFSADPALRLDLLTRVQTVKFEGGDRNLFQFGPAPAPKPVPAKAASNSVLPMTSKPPEPPPKPPPTPIPLKFYGYTSPGPAGERRAFFLDGDDILVAAEGALVKRRYRVVRIGLNSCVVEDVEQKYQQTLMLEEQTG